MGRRRGGGEMPRMPGIIIFIEGRMREKGRRWYERLNELVDEVFNWSHIKARQS